MSANIAQGTCKYILAAVGMDTDTAQVLSTLCELRTMLSYVDNEYTSSIIYHGKALIDVPPNGSGQVMSKRQGNSQQGID